jgi:hypothetical protein
MFISPESVANAPEAYAGTGRKGTGEETNLPFAGGKIDNPASKMQSKKPTGSARELVNV